MEKIKRVLQIGMTSNIGGMENYIITQYRYLNRKQIKYDFVNITGEKKIAYEDEILSNSSLIYSIPSRHKNPILHYVKFLYLLMSVRKKYDAIVLNTCSLDYIYPLFIAWLLCIPMRVIHSHNSGDEKKRNFLRKSLVLFNRTLMNISVNVRWACSKRAGDWMFGYHPYLIIHNAINVEKFLYKDDVRNLIRERMNLKNKLVVGSVARFSYQKNHEFLVRVFRELVKINPDCCLLLIGEYDSENEIIKRLKTYILNNHLEEYVMFLGGRKDVFELYQAMDCLLMPSKFEGLSVTAIEAQTADLWCFFSDNISKETKIIDKCKFIDLNESPKKWAELIDDCTRDSMNGARKDNRSLIEEKGYNIETEVKRVEMLYREFNV